MKLMNHKQDYYSPIKLFLIQKNDKIAIDQLSNNLKKNGWCLIDLEDVKPYLDNLILNIQSFFNFSLSEKASFINSDFFGYDITNIMEILRWQTNDNIKNSNFPQEFLNDTLLLNEFFDLFFESLIKNNFESLFGVKFTGSKIKNNSLFEKEQGYGIIDFVSYFPNLNKEKIKRNEIVSEHVNKGLLSFSIYNFPSGFEVFNFMANEWFEIPMKYGLIMSGLNAVKLSKNNLKGCLKRISFNKEEKGIINLTYDLNEIDRLIGIGIIDDNDKSDKIVGIKKEINKPLNEHKNKNEIIQKKQTSNVNENKNKSIEIKNKHSKIQNKKLNSSVSTTKDTKSKTSSVNFSNSSAKSKNYKIPYLSNHHLLIKSALKFKHQQEQQEEDLKNLQKSSDDNNKFKIKLTIIDNRRKKEIYVPLDYTIMYIKKLYERTTGISLSKSVVTRSERSVYKLNGEEKEKLDQNLTIQECGLKDGDILNFNLENEGFSVNSQQ